MIYNISLWFHSQEADLFFQDYTNVFNHYRVHYFWLIHDNIDHRGYLECCRPKCRWCVLDKFIEPRIRLFQKHWRKYRKSRFKKIIARNITGVWNRSEKKR